MTLEGGYGHPKPGALGGPETGTVKPATETGRDEAQSACGKDEGLGREDLYEKILSRENMVLAWKRVEANKGSAGLDGLSIEETAEGLKTQWPKIREELQNGQYRPQAVRRVEIPKPGGGVRELGIGNPDRGGSTDPTGLAASSSTVDRPDVLRVQFRISTGAECPWSRKNSEAIRAGRLPDRGRCRSREVFRQGEP